MIYLQIHIFYFFKINFNFFPIQLFNYINALSLSLSVKNIIKKIIAWISDTKNTKLN